MGTVKVVLRKDKVNKTGLAPLAIRITEHRKHSYLSLDARIAPNDWDNDACMVKKSHKNSGRINALIATKFAEAQSTQIEMKTKSKTVTAKKIKSEIVGGKPVEFFAHAQRYLDNLSAGDHIATHNRAKAVVAKFREYYKGGELLFDDFTGEVLTAYAGYLKVTLKNKPNTIHSNFKILKTIVYSAINDHLISKDKDPFIGIRVKPEPSKRTYLKADELKKIERLKLDHEKLEGKVRDMFVFACYAGGIRISDVLVLKWEDIKDGKMNVRMQKTGNFQYVKLPKPALAILQRYGGDPLPKSGFVFPFVTADSEIETPASLHLTISRKTALVNKVLKGIAEKAEIVSSLSFHVARHTFATRALSKGIRIEHVSKLLGHSDLKETQVYAKILSEDLDKAMNKFNK